MNRRQEIEVLARKIRRDRRLGLILSPFILGILGLNIWWKGRSAMAHFQQVLGTSLPKDTIPDLVRLRAISDFVPIVLDFILILIALSLFVFFAVRLLAPDPVEKLLLKVVEELHGTEEATSQHPTGERRH